MIEHREHLSRLVLLNIPNHQLRPLQPFLPELRWPVFSPGGTSVLYSDGDDLHLRRVDQDKDTIVARDVSPYDGSPYSFSPDGRTLAVLTKAGLLLLPAQDLTSPGKSPRTPVPKGCEFMGMLWSTDSDSVLVLCHLPPQTGNYDLLRVNRSTGQMLGAPIGGINRLLGWRGSSQLVVIRNPGGLGKLNFPFSSGGFEPLRPPAPQGEVIFVEAYVPGEDKVVLTRGIEDSGDSIVLFLAPLGPGPAKRWLAPYTRLSDLQFSRDGRWATFVNRFPGNSPEEGGDAYLVETGHDAAEPLLRGVPGRVSYSSPVLRP
jgi:hypothetical protein